MSGGDPPSPRGLIMVLGILLCVSFLLVCTVKFKMVGLSSWEPGHLAASFSSFPPPQGPGLANRIDAHHSDLPIRLSQIIATVSGHCGKV